MELSANQSSFQLTSKDGMVVMCVMVPAPAVYKIPLNSECVPTHRLHCPMPQCVPTHRLHCPMPQCVPTHRLHCPMPQCVAHSQVTLPHASVCAHSQVTLPHASVCGPLTGHIAPCLSVWPTHRLHCPMPQSVPTHKLQYITPWRTLTSVCGPLTGYVHHPMENTYLSVWPTHRLCTSPHGKHLPQCVAHSQVTYITPWKTLTSVCGLLTGYVHHPMENTYLSVWPTHRLRTSPHGKHLPQCVAHSQVTYITPRKTLTSVCGPLTGYVHHPMKNTYLSVWPTHRLRTSPHGKHLPQCVAHSQVTYITPRKTLQSVCPLACYIHHGWPHGKHLLQCVAHSQVNIHHPTENTALRVCGPFTGYIHHPMENTYFQVCAHSQVTYITPWKTLTSSVCPLTDYTSPHGKHLPWVCAHSQVTYITPWKTLTLSVCPLTGYIHHPMENTYLRVCAHSQVTSSKQPCGKHLPQSVCPLAGYIHHPMENTSECVPTPRLHHPMGNTYLRACAPFTGCIWYITPWKTLTLGSVPTHRLHRPMEWSLLLAMGHGVCQNPYTHHRVCVGAPAHHLGLLLLWSPHPGVCFSCWCVVLRQEHQRREGVLWVSDYVVGVGISFVCAVCVLPGWSTASRTAMMRGCSVSHFVGWYRY